MGMKVKLDQILSDATKQGDVPGVVATVGNREGVLYEAAFGERCLGEGHTMNVDTVWWIASMTKAITSVAAVQCVERGLLELDTPAKEVCPELGNIGVLEGFDENGQPNTRPPKCEITLRQLLTHTAGFGYNDFNPDIQKVHDVLGIPGVLDCKNRTLTVPLVFDPGERWEYGINIDWVGKTVEAASGKRLGDYFRQNIFEPLGMNSTGFKISDNMRSRLASTHFRGEDGQLTVYPLEVPQDPEFEMGGGGLYSTVQDYLQFLRMILNYGQLGGNRVLTPEGVVSLGLNHMGDSRVTRLNSFTKFANNSEFFPGMKKSWSLAFQINHESTDTGRPAGGLMWAGLANSYFWIDQSTGLAGVYATQIFPFADEKSFPLYLAFEKGVYSQIN